MQTYYVIQNFKTIFIQRVQLHEEETQKDQRSVIINVHFTCNELYACAGISL
jgi:hypothetical protein